MLIPYRLLSLWEMLELPIGRLLACSHHLSVLGQMLSPFVHNNPDRKRPLLSSADYREVLSHAEGFVECCGTIGLTTTQGLAREILADIESIEDASDGYVPTFPLILKLHNKLMALPQCLRHESAAKVAFLLPPDKVALYEPSGPLWGAVVSAKFGTAQYDIVEAAKCLALGRSTATVFHLTRALGVALHAVATCLGVQTAGPNWGDILRVIREERVRRGPNWDEKELFQDLYARLDSIKDAWRNPSAHDVAAVYTEGEAKSIYENVEAFMRKIASRMDENGLPLA